MGAEGGGCEGEEGGDTQGSALEHLAGLDPVSEEGYSLMGLAPSPWSSSRPFLRPALPSCPRIPAAPSERSVSSLGGWGWRNLTRPKGLDLGFRAKQPFVLTFLSWLKWVK